MSKITLNNVADLTQTTTAATTINTNSSTVQTAFDNTLSRDGTSPNQMGAALDMNSNQIINLPAPSTQNSPARLIDVVSNPTIVVPGTGTSGHTVPFLDGNNTWSGTNVLSNTTTFNSTSTFNGNCTFNGINNFWDNGRQAKTTTYVVLNTDKGSTLALRGSAFYSITFNTPSGYDSNFQCVVLNEDTTRAKWVILTGGISFYLWPLQTVLILNQNNTWQVVGRSRWRLPSSITLNTDFGSGTDAVGGTDGLALTSGAFQTMNNAYSIAFQEFDLEQNVLTILMASGSTSTEQVHIAGTIPGKFGHNSVVFDGNGGVLQYGVSGGVFQTFNDVYSILRNVTLQNTGGSVNLIEAHDGATIEVHDLVNFGSAAGGAQVYVTDHGNVTFQNNITINGGGLFAVFNDGGTVKVPAGITASVGNNITYTGQVILSQNPGSTLFANITWGLGGHTVTGTKYNVVQNSVLSGSANVPGTVSGTTGSGGQAI